MTSVIKLKPHSVVVIYWMLITLH